MKELELSLDAIREKYQKETPLSDLFVSIEKELQDAGFVVCQYVLNGMNLSEDDEKRLGASTVQEIEDLRVKYSTPSSLLASILSGWMAEIPMLIQQSDELSSSARELKLDAKMPHFIRFIENSQLLVESLISLRTVVNLEGLGIAEVWHSVEIEFNAAIAEALDSFQKKDLNQLADVLEYDIAHSLQKWFDLLKQIDESLKDDREDTSRSDSSAGALGE